MRKISVILFLMASLSISAQSFDCKKDSTLYRKIEIYLDSSNLGLGVKTIKDSFKMEPQNCLCNLIAFTMIFDDMIKQGLEFDDKIMLRKPILLSGNIKEEQDWNTKEQVADIVTHNHKHNLYYEFTKIQPMYIKYVVIFYKSFPQSQFKNDINNIITYGSFSKPLFLKDILSLKYEYITRDYINDIIINARKKE